MKVFTSKFVCNDLYLLIAIFIIYVQSFTKVFSTAGTSYRMAGLSVK